MADEKQGLDKLPPPPPLEIVAREAGGLRPHYSGSYGYGYGTRSDDQKIHLRELWRTVRKRKWLIVALVFVITTLVTIEMYRTKNTYQAGAMVEVGKDTSRLGAPGASIFGDDYDPFYMVNMKTKMLTLKSRPLLESVVLENHLDQNPRFLQAGGKKSIWEALKLMGAKVGISQKPADDDAPVDDVRQVVTANDSSAAPTPEAKKKIDACVALLYSGLSVDSVKETKALRISFSHTDPEIAALVTNAVAEKFLNQNFFTKTKKFDDAAKWLDAETNRFKAKLQEAEEKRTAYAREHGFFFTDKDGTLTTGKLQQLHDAALRAQSDRVIKESLYQEVKEGRVIKNPEAYADLLYKSAPKMVDLQRQLGDLQTQRAELLNTYGEDAPKVKDVTVKIAEIQQQIKGSLVSLEEKLKTEFERAQRDEQKFNTMLVAAKNEASTQNQAQIEYNLLTQEVTTNRQ